MCHEDDPLGINFSSMDAITLLIVTSPNRMQGKLTTARLTLRHSLQTSINESEYNEKLVQIIIQGHLI